MSERYLVTSHGFATDPDSGKLFSTAAKYLLSERQLINFDHYKKYKKGDAGDIYVPSLDEQTENLTNYVRRLDGEVVLMGHSRGTTSVCGAATLNNVTNVILMAPLHEAGSDTIVAMIRERGGGEGDDGELTLHRNNSESKIYISKDYFPNMEAFDHIGTYQQVANSKPTVIVTGARDKVVDQSVIQQITNATHISVDSGHNLHGDQVREKLAIELAVAIGERAVFS
jgi:pimeloyl-ACP methyl ester carboxylesterase